MAFITTHVNQVRLFSSLPFFALGTPQKRSVKRYFTSSSHQRPKQNNLKNKTKHTFSLVHEGYSAEAHEHERRSIQVHELIARNNKHLQYLSSATGNTSVSHVEKKLYTVQTNLLNSSATVTVFYVLLGGSAVQAHKMLHGLPRFGPLYTVLWKRVGEKTNVPHGTGLSAQLSTRLLQQADLRSSRALSRLLRYAATGRSGWKHNNNNKGIFQLVSKDPRASGG